jgi:hypothetical protein
MTDLININDCIALPDITYAAIHFARQDATCPKRIAQLIETQYQWLAESGRVGTVLDDRDSLGLLTQTIKIETPDGRMMTFPAYRARELAGGYAARYGVNVRHCDGTYVVEMDDWATVADAPAAA